MSNPSEFFDWLHTYFYSCKIQSSSREKVIETHLRFFCWNLKQTFVCNIFHQSLWATELIKLISVTARLWTILLISIQKMVMMIYLYHGYDNNRYITTNIFKYHILLIYLQEFSFPFPLLTLFKFLSTRKTIFSIGCRTLFMYPDPRWYGMIPSVWNCRNFKHSLFMIFENLFWISICSDTLSIIRLKYQISYWFIQISMELMFWKQR